MSPGARACCLIHNGVNSRRLRHFTGNCWWMGGVFVRIDRPPLVAALAARGVPLWRDGVPDAVVAAASDWRHAARGAPAFVLARDEEEAVAAIEAGADDAVPHWTGDSLIAARLASWLRRCPSVVRIGDLAIDPVAHCATREGRALDLLPREYALLLHLARNAGRVVGRRELLARIWGLDFDPGTNVVEVHVSRLRARLDRGFAHPMLRTEKRVGYCLAAPSG